MTDKETQVDSFIKRFGSQSKLARALGHNNPTTVQSWRRKGFIPSDQEQHVFDVCKIHNIDVTIHDFVNVIELKQEAS